MSLVHVPVVGAFTYRDANATPAAGEKIHFIARTAAVVDGDVVTLPKKLVVTLNADGEVPVGFELPTVGDGVYYDVRERFSGGRDTYTIQVLTTDTEIDLATVAPVVPTEDMASYVELGDFEALQQEVDDLTAVVGDMELLPGALVKGRWETITPVRIADIDYADVAISHRGDRLLFEMASGFGAISLRGPIAPPVSNQDIRLPAASGTIALLSDLDDFVEGPASSVDNTLPRFNGTDGKTMQGSGISVSDSDEIAGYKGSINRQTGTTYTLRASDSGKVLEFANAAAIVVTLPDTLPQGWCATLVQDGAGQVSLTAAGSATLKHRQSHTKLAGDGAMGTLYVSSNAGTSAAYRFGGDTAA